MSRILIFIFIGFLALQLPASDMNFNVMTPAPFHRSEAPVPITVQTFSNKPYPVSGIMEIKIFSGPELIETVYSNEITILPGAQLRNILLPPISDMEYYSSYLKITFIAPDKQYAGGRQELVSIHDGVRVFTLLTGYRDFQGVSDINFAQELKFEKLTDKKEDRVPLAHSGIVKLNSDNFPKSVEAYCAYNMVVLDGKFFSDMNANELSVLKEWVLAGGSLFINPGNGRFELSHVKFLNDLIQADSIKNSTLMLKSSGKLQFSEHADYSLYCPGFGRFVLFNAHVNVTEYFQKSEWRLLLAFLWRVNSNRLKCVINNRAWLYSKDDVSYQESYHNDFQYAVDSYYRYNDSEDLNSIFQGYISMFLPKTTRMIPVWLLVLIFISFILLVGPLDYMILGKFKKHNITWIMFPLISIIYAFIIVHLADHYMGTDDHIGTLEVMDEGSNGEILRSVTYEVMFTGASKTVIRDCRHEFFSRQERSTVDSSYRYRGMLFSHYSSEFAATQWRPTINRVNSFHAVSARHPAWSFPEKWDRDSRRDFLKQHFISRDETLDISILKNGYIRTLRKSQNRRFKSFISQMQNIMNRYAEYGSLTPYLSAVSPTPEYGEKHLLIGDSTDKECKVLIVSIYNEKSRSARIYRRVYTKKPSMNLYSSAYCNQIKEGVNN